MGNLHVRLIWTFCLIALFSIATSAQGILRGKVIDAETGEELIGATVMLKGTTIGAATDLDGNYNIPDIPSVTYTVVCQYISYQPQEFEHVEVSSGKVTVINIKLSSVSVGLQEVQVTAKMQQRTEAALLTVQKKSANVIDGISAQAISRSGASEAAGALRRVTGVNVEGGRYVYVRGLSDRYSKTTLNGADIPGLDPNRNTVQMDLFPTNLIDNIIVYKTFSPNLPGDFTGGLINVVTKDFPEKFTVQAGLRLGYNTSTSFNSRFLSYQGSATDFLGYDNGFRNIPEAARNRVPSYPAQKQQLTDITMGFNKIMAPDYQPSGMNTTLSFSIGNQVDVGKKGSQLGYLLGLSYKSGEENYENGTKGLYTLGGSSDQNLTMQHLYNDNQSAKNVLWGIVGNLTYKFSRNHKISFNLMKNQSGVSLARFMYGPKPSDEKTLIIQTSKLQWLQRSLLTGQLRGEHFIEPLSKLKLEWQFAVSSSSQDEPDMRFFTNSYYPDLEAPFNYAIEPSIYKAPSRFYRNMDQMNYFGKIDLALDLGNKTHAPKLKFGGLYSYQKRNFEEQRFDYQFQFSPNVYNGSVSEFLADDNIGINYDLYPQPGIMGLYVQESKLDNLRNSYKANQTVGASYLMIDALTFTKLRVIAGLRYEYTQINSASYDSTLPAGYLKNNDILPAVALTWLVKNNMNLRFNYSRTLARPSFRELAPYASEDFAGGETWIGNDTLKRTLIDNIDLRWENYFRPGEILSLGAFYKLFHNPIEVVNNPKAQNPELSWQNVEQAKVYGFELDFRKKLDFWNFTKHVWAGINFTYIYSQVAIDSLELSAIRATDPSAKSTRPMFGQSPYIINAFLGYENPDLGLEVNLTYNVSGPKIVINIKGGTPDIYAQPVNLLNLTANQRIAKRWSLNLRVKNILNTSYKETYTYKGQEYIYRQFKAGVLFELGFKFKI